MSSAPTRRSCTSPSEHRVLALALDDTLTVLIATAAIAAVNAAADIYGLYRNPAGRRLPVYGDARVAKYLLSQRYVPENFNAI